ncbi:MAG: rhomboid family intramembrane serine protease [Prevotellaceae bacterium]|jgi:membrane associated rhomboid family serine protease|nr:rhomboid family intramembrane serine protease [Prevotellaceae bacterium]
MDLTLILIIITVLASIAAFESPRIFDRLLLSPYMIVHRNEWYRVITHGFIHANWAHLLINMFVFYSFGQALTYYLSLSIGNTMIHFLAVYFGGMVFATLTTIVKHRNNYAYRGIGASGAVSAVLFACIFFNPWSKLLFMGIIPVPGIIFAALYLLYCTYMSRNSNDNINHDAHLYGALFGFVYPIVVEPDLLRYFINMLMHPSFN